MRTFSHHSARRLIGTIFFLTLHGLTLLPGFVAAGPLRDLIKERRHVDSAENANTSEASSGTALPSGVRVLRDIAYGNDPRQRMDVYLPREAKAAPVILMVHGGAWRLGAGQGAVPGRRLGR